LSPPWCLPLSPNVTCVRGRAQNGLPETATACAPRGQNQRGVHSIVRWSNMTLPQPAIRRFSWSAPSPHKSRSRFYSWVFLAMVRHSSPQSSCLDSLETTLTLLTFPSVLVQRPLPSKILTSRMIVLQRERLGVIHVTCYASSARGRSSDQRREGDE